MTIQPITDRVPACFGVMCQKHGRCARYDAVNATADTFRIATCDTGTGEHPLFVDNQPKDPT